MYEFCNNKFVSYTDKLHKFRFIQQINFTSCKAIDFTYEDIDVAYHEKWNHRQPQKRQWKCGKTIGIVLVLAEPI